MSNKELINAYFDGELSEVERQNLFSEIDKNPELKAEFNFQNEIVEGLKRARVAELKARLDNVPVSGGTISTGSTFLKVAVVTGVALIGALSYFYINKPEQEPISVEPKTLKEDVEELLEIEESTQDVVMAEQIEVNEPINEAKEATKNKVVKEKETIPSSPIINKPSAIQPIELDDTDDNDEIILPSTGLTKNNVTAISTIDIETDNSKKKYAFHYQLKEGKLFLFGDFDHGLYELLEFNANEGKILYLFYKGQYFNLDKNQVEITPLTVITDSTLIQELETVRKELKE